MRILSYIVGLALFAAPASALAAAVEASPPREEPAAPRERPGESDNLVPAFRPRAVPHRALHFADPAIAALAERVYSGRVDLRDLRAWYEISLLYAPFDSLPPAGWRQQAIRDGAAISIETRRRQAAQAAGPGGGPAGALQPDAAASPDTGSTVPDSGSDSAEASQPFATYAWSNLGPTNYTV